MANQQSARILSGFEATEEAGRFALHFVDDAGETIEIEAQRENIELIIRNLQALLGEGAGRDVLSAMAQGGESGTAGAGRTSGGASSSQAGHATGDDSDKPANIEEEDPLLHRRDGQTGSEARG